MDRPTKTIDKLKELPMFRNADLAKIDLKGTGFKKGEKPVVNVTTLAIVGGLIFVAIKFLYPLLLKLFEVSIMILTMAFAVGLIIFLYMVKDLIYLAMKKVVKYLNKELIKSDIWGTFEEQGKIFLEQEKEVIASEAIIVAAERNMMANSKINEEKARNFKERLIELEQEVSILLAEKAKYDSGALSKESHEFADVIIALNDAAAESERISSQYQQSKDLVIKFGVEGNTFNKFLVQFKYYLSSIKNRKKDFDVSVEILKTEYEATNAIAAGTGKVKQAMMFNDKWEVKYATELAQTAIDYNIAITKSNIMDIKDVMSSLGENTNPEKAFSKLKLLTKNMEEGIDNIPKYKRYLNPELKLTSEETSSTPFGDVKF